MSITEKEAFELGFLQRCADEGLTPQQTQLRLKKAEALIKTGGLADALSTMGLVGGTAAATAGAGFGSGWLRRKLEGDFLDPEDVKKQELIEAYRRATSKAQRPQVAQGL